MVLKASLTYNNIFIQNPQFKSSGGTQILNFFCHMNGSLYAYLHQLNLRVLRGFNSM
jgi:hypothetical protein